MTRSKKRAIVMISIVVSALLVGIVIGYVWGLIAENDGPYKYSEYVKQYSAEYGIPEELLYAVIRVESNFDRHAKSSVGALGLMQIMPRTFEWLTGDEHLDEHLPTFRLYDARTNIRYGAYYLSYLHEKFEDWDTVLAAYNGGEGNVAKWLADKEYSDDGVTLKSIPFKETRNYVEKVNDAMDTYKKFFN